MYGKKWLSCLIIMGISMMMMVTANAAQSKDRRWEESAQEITTVNTYTDSMVAMVKGITRGMLISSVEVDLSKEGFGIAGIYGEILCHEPMSSIRMTLILQKWNENNSKWEEVNRKEFEWTADKLPEGETLTMATASYNIAGLKSGQTYRLRGLFGAYDLEGTYNEAWNASTDGLEF